jgi:predicted TIM-barrel fold metal-dependent hydrolase
VFEQGYRAVEDPQYTFPDGSLEQYLAMAEFLGIERMVLVQPTYYGVDNSLLLDTLGHLGDRARGVARIADDVSPGELATLDLAGVRAIRLDLFERKGWSLEALREYVASMASLARSLGWHIQFYSPGALVRDLLPFLVTLDVPFVVDHMGYMRKSDGLEEAFQGLVTALSSGNCYVKLTGPYRVAGDAPLATVHDIGAALVEARADRLLWGTDWPHLPDGGRDTGELLNLLGDWAPDEADRNQILVTTPDELFFR